MFKELVDRILELGRKPTIEDAYGRQHMLPDYKAVQDSTVDGFKTRSLTSIVEYIEQNIDHEFQEMIIHIKAHDKVILCSGSFGQWEQRHQLIEANAEVPGFNFDSYYNQETFVINLLSKFEKSDARDYALGIASNLVEDQEIIYSDDGLSQQANVRAGVTTVSKETIDPFVLLKPTRTFLEVEQPASIFLLRLRKGNQIGIFEADQGKWKLEAIENIFEYFHDTFKDNDKVKILY